MNIRLTNKERESLEWLQHFTNQLLQGEPVEYTKPVVDQLRKKALTWALYRTKRWPPW